MKIENELRIGNYIQYMKDGYIKYDTVKSIYYDDELKIYRIELNNRDFNLYHLTVNGINPIQLNIEILKKCGFKTQEEGLMTRYVADCSIKVEIGHDNIYTYLAYNYGCGGRWIFTKAKFLHQLQNLYYSISGEELNITI